MQKELWLLKPMTAARMITGQPLISVRWVCKNKGDNQNPNVRARFVVRQIRSAGEYPLFGPTPPLEALRSVLFIAATDFEHDASA